MFVFHFTNSNNKALNSSSGWEGRGAHGNTGIGPASPTSPSLQRVAPPQNVGANFKQLPAPPKAPPFRGTMQGMAPPITSERPPPESPRPKFPITPPVKSHVNTAIPATPAPSDDRYTVDPTVVQRPQRPNTLKPAPPHPAPPTQTLNPPTVAPIAAAASALDTADETVRLNDKTRIILTPLYKSLIQRDFFYIVDRTRAETMLKGWFNKD